MLQTAYWLKWPKCKYQKNCGPDVSILAGPLSKAESAFDKGPAIGSKRQARIFLDIYILVTLVSKQFATFLHISLMWNPCN